MSRKNNSLSLSLSLSPHTALKSSLGTYNWANGVTENVAGAKFNRKVNESGPHPVEVLTSRGPISELVTVEVCR